MIEQGSFQRRFLVLREFGQPGEFKHIRIADQIGDGLRGINRLFSSSLNHRLFIGRKPGAFIQERFNLALKLAD